jgi:hypothetical protein
LILPGFFCNYAARLSRKKAIIVSAALLAFFIVGLTPPEFRATLSPSNVARNLFRLLAVCCFEVFLLAVLSFETPNHRRGGMNSALRWKKPKDTHTFPVQRFGQ